jgi:hypothetical protein
VPWPFGSRRKAAGELFERNHFGVAFDADLLALREDWESRIAASEIDEPNKIVLLSASAGATVACGSFGAFLILHFEGKKALLPDGGIDPVVAFANRLTSDPEAIENAYRVTTWGYVAEFANFYWRPNYELDMRVCAEVFEFRNDYEGEVASLGWPIEADADVMRQADRLGGLVKGMLINAIRAAMPDAYSVDWDDPFVGMHLPQWNDQFEEGLDVAKERLRQLAPRGLPIWQEEA